MCTHGAILPMYYAVLQNLMLFKIYFIVYNIILKEYYFISFEIRLFKHNIIVFKVPTLTYLTFLVNYKQCFQATPSDMKISCLNILYIILLNILFYFIILFSYIIFYY